MSFFGSLTGSTQRKDIRRGLQQSTEAMNKGNEEATNFLNTGYGQANTQLATGLQRSNQQISTGYGQARSDVLGNTSAALKGANSALQPYAAQGQRANTMYGNALGINGTGARGAAQNTYMNDPIMEQLMASSDKNIFQRYNAGGMGDSGASRAAVLQGRYDNYGNWLDRLNGQGQQGFAAAGQMGQNTANIYQNRGNALAGLATGRADRLSSNTNSYTGMQAGNRVNRANALASNRINLANGNANNITGAASAVANTRGMGWQNALNLGSMALKAYTGMGV